MLRPALILALSGTTVEAQTRMTAEEFESWSTGRTLDYRIDGQLWGSEQHFPDRRTLDADAGGACVTGQWYPQGDDICFRYETGPGPHCWSFWRDGDRVLARIAGNPDSPVAEVTISDQPLACPGPDLGS